MKLSLPIARYGAMGKAPSFHTRVKAICRWNKFDPHQWRSTFHSVRYVTLTVLESASMDGNASPHTSLSTRCHSHHMTHTEDASVTIHLPRNCPYLLRAMAQWVRHPRFIPGLKQFVGRTSSIPTSGGQLSTVCAMSHLQYLGLHP